MDKSLSHFELNDNNSKNGSESGSEKSESTIDMFAFGDTDSSNGSKGDEDFDNNLPDTVNLIVDSAKNTKVYIVGTAHFSKESQEDVEKVIQHVQPDIVILELCSSRLNILNLDEESILKEAQEINARKILSTIKSNGVYNGIIYLLLLDMSAHITKEIGMAPGGEFRVAYREVAKLPKCKILLGDRPISITLKRAIAGLSWFQTFKLIWHLINSKDPVSKEDIEKCKNRDMLEQILAEFAEHYPEFKEVFVAERDIFLTYSLQNAVANLNVARKPDAKNEPNKIVAVVGIGHMPGILKLYHIDQRPFIKDMLTIPPPSRVSKFIKLSFRVSLYVVGGYIVYRYVPVPKLFKNNVHVVVQQMLTSLNPSKINFNYNRF
ncbi:traB domain-containing protein [Coccinella septempunctata]|uniref:traB domain-containing protein n=1 Tax=Coccinella septempunctata TaxID=41139 RepID=UPI001D05FE10|nr:traB domain-containing protein [Coccinella septempunctata]